MLEEKSNRLQDPNKMNQKTARELWKRKAYFKMERRERRLRTNSGVAHLNVYVAGKEH